jgi:hypothetical protein
MAQALPPKRRLNIWDLRRLFNEGKYIQKITSQELTARSIRCNEVDPNSDKIGSTIPKGSISQTLRLFDANNDFVAEFQRYIRPEGTIGASGYNDPKRMGINGLRFHQQEPGKPQPRLSSREINQILQKRGLAALRTYLISFYYKVSPPPT